MKKESICAKLVKISAPFPSMTYDKGPKGIVITFWAIPKWEKKIKQFFFFLESDTGAKDYPKDFSTLLLANEGDLLSFTILDNPNIKGLGIGDVWDVKNITHPELTVDSQMQIRSIVI